MARSPYLYFEPHRIAKLKNLNLLVRQAIQLKQRFPPGFAQSCSLGFGHA